VPRSRDPVPARRIEDARVDVFVLRFRDALRAGDATLAEGVAQEAVEAGLDTGIVLCRVVGPAMDWIGDQWECGAITVADEHLATAISHNVLASLFPRLLKAAPGSRERVMLAGAPGEQHVLGLKVVADILEGAGFDVLYLGADVPVDDLIDACRRHRPDVLGLSVTVTSNVPSLLTELVKISKLEHPPLLLVGGDGLPEVIRGRVRLPIVRHGENVVRTIEDMLSQGSQGSPLETSLQMELPQDEPAADTVESEHGSLPEQLSAAVLASADTARDASRRAWLMEELAFHDPLTGAWNRRAFDDRFAELVELSESLNLLMVDVDSFKTINDTWGHEAGDSTLVTVAHSILNNVRPGDFVARFGGDEFVVLLPRAGALEASEIAERVRAGIEDELRAPPVTVSIGITSFTGDQRLTGLSVDRALYEAKAGGRNRVVVGHS
jgi:diguanylate cyclase (GGDEF)-like protein